MKLMIYGASGFAKEIYDTAMFINNNRWEEYIFIDDFDNDKLLYGNKVISFSKFVKNYDVSDVDAIVGVGEPSSRELLVQRINKYSINVVSIIHPTAVISSSCSLGRGVYIGPFSFVSCNTILSDNIVVQPHVIIGHDVKIGDSSVLGPNSTIAGECEIGDRTYIGMNACIEQKLTIGNDVIIGMSSCVARDIPSEVIAMGYPARIVGKNENKKVF